MLNPVFIFCQSIAGSQNQTFQLPANLGRHEDAKLTLEGCMAKKAESTPD